MNKEGKGKSGGERVWKKQSKDLITYQIGGWDVWCSNLLYECRISHHLLHTILNNTILKKVWSEKGCVTYHAPHTARDERLSRDCTYMVRPDLL